MSTNLSDTVKISQALPENASALSKLLAKTWLATYPNEEFDISIEDINRRVYGTSGERLEQSIHKWERIISEIGPNKLILTAKTGHAIIGMVGANIDDNELSRGNITALYVLPEAQGNGVGTKLMTAALAWLGKTEDICVVVASYNQKAIGFYKRFGFQETGNQIEDLSARRTGDKEIPEIEMILKRSRD